MEDGEDKVNSGGRKKGTEKKQRKENEMGAKCIRDEKKTCR
jgi:hypothetical protein